MSLSNKEYDQAFDGLTRIYLKASLSPSIPGTDVVDYKIHKFYDYSGVIVKSSDLPEVANDYVAYIIDKYIENRSSKDFTGVERIHESTQYIKNNNCENILESHSIISNSVSSEELSCIKAYGKMYAMAMEISGYSSWETPVGCCKLIVTDVDGATIATYS